MTEVDVSNPDLLRNIDPIRKSVYDEEGEAKFNIGHLHAPPPKDLFGWAEKERGKKAVYQMVECQNADGELWELDVKPLISSRKWLQVHGLHRNRLTMKQILSQIGFKHSETFVDSVKKPVGSYYGHGLFQQFRRKDGQLYNVTVGRAKLQQIEESLTRSSHLFKRRLQWLTTGSRRIFGVVQEHCICIIVDVTTMSQTQFDLYREALCDVIRDQVSQLAKFNMIKAQADMIMWQEQATPVTELTIKNAIEWVQQLDRMAETSRTASMEAIMRAMEDDTLESVYLFAEGDACESSKELLRQKVSGLPHPLHGVSFNASKSSSVKFIKEVALTSGGRFHAFVVKSIHEEDSEALPSNAAPPGGDASRISVRLSVKPQGGVPAGAGVREDVFQVWLELEEARNSFAQIQTLLHEIPDPKTEIAVIDRPRPLESRQEQYMRSSEWLKRHGLEARGVTAFQTLASCSFRHVDGVVDLKGKPAPCAASSDAENVRKLINAKYCNQFAHTKWKDGTLVHVHITAEKHKMFEKKMKTTLDAIQQRIDWLQQGSREVFGTILEEQVYILIDTSQSMKDKLAMLKEKVFQLMQEQLRHKSKFNFVKFDTKAVAWKDKAVDVTEQNLLNAWNWVKDIGVGGSTNTLAALRIALADPYTHAIYLLTDGRPDQSQHMFWRLLHNPRSVLAQVQLQHPVPVHTIAFNCNDLEANKFLHQLSSDTGGRYHNFSTEGCGMPGSPPPFESEDVSLLKKELDRGRKDLEKVSRLRARCVMLDWFHNKQHKSTRHLRSLSNDDVRQGRNSQGEDGTESDASSRSGVHRRPHTSLGFRPSPPKRPQSGLSIAHKNHRGSAGVNDRAICRRKRVTNHKAQDSNRAGHTRTSVLRFASVSTADTNGWMLPESKEFMQDQLNKSVEAYQDIMRANIEKQKPKKKKKKKRVNPLDIPNSVWLKKNGLVARKLTVMDVLTPTIVKVTPKYIPVLKSHVVSKVFNDVLPIAHVSPRHKQEVHLVNPAAVDLLSYEERLKKAIAEYKERLDVIVWRNLSQEERDGFEGDGPISYLEEQKALDAALERLEWPVSRHELLLLVDEITQGERYMQQSRDLRETAKKVAMGARKDKQRDDDTSHEKKISKERDVRKKKKVDDRSKDDSASSDSDDDSSESSDESSRDSDRDSSDDVDRRPRVRARAPRKINGLYNGQRVIARDGVDGFYYDGAIRKVTSVRHARVSYDHDGEENVPIRFVIPRTGAVSCPPLKVLDYVLAYSDFESNVACYVPGIVIGASDASMQVRKKFFTILLFNERKVQLRRKHLVKISESRYTFSVRYIQNARPVADRIPSVTFEKAPLPQEENNPKRVVVEVSSASSSETSSVTSSSSSSESSLDDEKRPSRKSRPKAKTDNGLELIRGDVARLQNQLEESAREQQRQRQLLQDQGKALEEARDLVGKIAAKEDEPRVSKANKAVNTDRKHITNSATSTDDKPLPAAEPSEWQRTETESESPPQLLIAVDENAESALVAKGDEGVFISRAPPSVKVELRKDEEVLHRCLDDGWYYRGTVVDSYPDDMHDIADRSNYVQRTKRDDIITDEDDAKYVLEIDDKVVALYPNFPNSYAPAIVHKRRPDSCFEVRYYDGTLGHAPRDEIYKLDEDKYEVVVKYIKQCEKRWVGEAVVARSDTFGEFHLASCEKRVGNGHQFLLRWADGSSSVQNLFSMFGPFTAKRDMNSGDYVIAVADPTNLIYLPGRVAAITDNKLKAIFCDGNTNEVPSSQCFWITKEYHDLAVAFYRNAQLQLSKS